MHKRERRGREREGRAPERRSGTGKKVEVFIDIRDGSKDICGDVTTQKHHLLHNRTQCILGAMKPGEKEK
jgi:hypothetical protein